MVSVDIFCLYSNSLLNVHHAAARHRLPPGRQDCVIANLKVSSEVQISIFGDYIEWRWQAHTEPPKKLICWVNMAQTTLVIWTFVWCPGSLAWRVEQPIIEPSQGGHQSCFRRTIIVLRQATSIDSEENPSSWLLRKFRVFPWWPGRTCATHGFRKFWPALPIRRLRTVLLGKMSCPSQHQGLTEVLHFMV